MSVGHQMARKLKTGSVRINGGVNLDANLPFGGAKMSGWGREYGRDGVEAFFEFEDRLGRADGGPRTVRRVRHRSQIGRRSRTPHPLGKWRPGPARAARPTGTRT